MCHDDVADLRSLMKYHDPLNAGLVLPFQRLRDGRSTLPVLPSLPQLGLLRCSEPPLRLISRLTVDGARPRPWAMCRIDRSTAMPREISSRSSSLSAAKALRRCAGTTEVDLDVGGNREATRVLAISCIRQKKKAPRVTAGPRGTSTVAA